MEGWWGRGLDLALLEVLVQQLAARTLHGSGFLGSSNLPREKGSVLQADVCVSVCLFAVHFKK